MPQTSVRTTIIKNIIATQAFCIGYDDAKNGRGFDQSYDDFHEKAQFDYERGRQFFFVSGGRISPYEFQKKGFQAVSPAAIDNFAWHYSRGNIL